MSWVWERLVSTFPCHRSTFKGNSVLRVPNWVANKSESLFDVPDLQSRDFTVGFATFLVIPQSLLSGETLPRVSLCEQKPLSQLLNTVLASAGQSERLSTYNTGGWRCGSSIHGDYTLINIAWAVGAQVIRWGSENQGEALSRSLSHTHHTRKINNRSRLGPPQCMGTQASSVLALLDSLPLIITSSFIHLFLNPRNIYRAFTLCQVPGIQWWTIYYPYP